jgi:hypothetical protein
MVSPGHRPVPEMLFRREVPTRPVTVSSSKPEALFENVDVFLENDFHFK